MEARAAVSGVRVLEGPGRLANAVCASLLAQLGAEVIRLTCSEPEAEREGAWRRLSADADVLIGSLDAMPSFKDDGPILCAISTTGEHPHPDLDRDAPEWVIQALGGLMATSGRADGPPETVRVPLLEIFTGVDAAVAILSALRVVEAGGPAQLIDAAVWDTNASLLGTFVAQVTAGKASGFRDGSRHSICAPWNAYPARNGHVMICTSSDAHWRRLLDVMDNKAANADSRFADMGSRRKNIAAVDALVTSWTSTRAVADIVASLRAYGIPAGAIASASEIAGKAAAYPFQLSRTPLRQAHSTATMRDWSPRATIAKRRTSTVQPLKNIRVVEIGPFTAGPLTGRSLADLGADVLKVEPVNGEVSRAWSPRAGHISGYFANYNVGKKSAVIDLATDQGRTTLDKLLAGADVLVQNLKAGALEKLGFGVDAVTVRHPHLIYCSISGYGRQGAPDAALDTVIQAQSGIMSLVGHSEVPCKVGFSVADLIAGHLAPLGIVAALRARDRDGRGQHVDVSMLDALHWIMQTGGERTTDIEVGECVKTPQGWALRTKSQDIRIRDLGEVFADPSLRTRGMLRTVPSGTGHSANVMGSPYALSHTPPQPGPMIGETGVDLDRVLAEWTAQSRMTGDVA